MSILASLDVTFFRDFGFWISCFLILTGLLLFTSLASIGSYLPVNFHSSWNMNIALFDPFDIKHMRVAMTVEENRTELHPVQCCWKYSNSQEHFEEQSSSFLLTGNITMLWQLLGSSGGTNVSRDELDMRHVAVQNQYCLTHRMFESEPAEAYALSHYNIGLMAFSILAGGVLSVKYIGKVDGDSNILNPVLMNTTLEG